MSRTAKDDKMTRDEFLRTHVAHLDLSVRIRNCIMDAGYTTIGSLLAGSCIRDLLKVRNFGQTSLDELRQRLREYGLRFKDEPSDQLWISAELCQPHDSFDVLVFVGGNINECYVGRYLEDDWIVPGSSSSNVKFWMLLPEPPTPVG